MDLREEKYTKGTGFTNTLIGYRFKKDTGDTGLKIQLMDIILTNTVSRYRFRESYNYVLIWFENFQKLFFGVAGK